MWYRAGAVMGKGKGGRALPLLTACFSACLFACGDEGSRPALPEPAPPEPAPATNELPSELSESDAAFRLSIDGWAEELGAKAQLNVTEGRREVRLEITGTGQVDVLFLDLDFDGVEGSMGLHQVEIGLPGDAINSAIASLGGQPYHSQSGRMEVTLAADGSIQGNFAVSLALDPEFAPDEPIEFEPSDEVRPLSGEFAGTWDLFCQSHLPGHSGAFMKCGDYCEKISFE
jgi:hypothetical protein